MKPVKMQGEKLKAQYSLRTICELLKFPFRHTDYQDYSEDYSVIFLDVILVMLVMSRVHV